MHMSKLERNIFLVGIMGAGKTTVARRLARNLHVAAIDVDSYMRNLYGKDAPTLFREVGESRFREMEAQALEACSALGPAVISCSEGVVVTEQGRDVLKRCGFTVMLQTSYDCANSRIRSLRTRPLLAQGNDAAEIMEQRLPLLQQVADAIVDVCDKGTASAAGSVERVLKAQGLYKEE